MFGLLPTPPTSCFAAQFCSIRGSDIYTLVVCLMLVHSGIWKPLSWGNEWSNYGSIHTQIIKYYFVINLRSQYVARLLLKSVPRLPLENNAYLINLFDLKGKSDVLYLLNEHRMPINCCRCPWIYTNKMAYIFNLKSHHL